MGERALLLMGQIARFALLGRELAQQPLVGRVAGLEGLVVAVGFSGHGFAIAPEVGRAVAEVILGRPAPTLAGLSPDRIRG